jgi:hypothetical protein
LLPQLRSHAEFGARKWSRASWKLVSADEIGSAWTCLHYGHDGLHGPPEWLTCFNGHCEHTYQRAFGVTTFDECGAPATLEATLRDYRGEVVHTARLCSNCALDINPEGLTLPVLTLPGHDHA